MKYMRQNLLNTNLIILDQKEKRRLEEIKERRLWSINLYIITYMYVMEIKESTLEQVISSLNDYNLISWTLLYNDKIIRIERIEKNNQPDTD